MTRDLAGTMRMLAALDPAVIDHLTDESRRSLPGSARAQALEAALAGLVAPARRPDRGGIAPGHNWQGAPFQLGSGYER